MGSFAHSNCTSKAWANAAHQWFVTQHALQAASVSTQLQRITDHVWGIGKATAAELTQWMQHLQNGGTWADVWLALVNDQRLTVRMPQDLLGRVTLIHNDFLHETGWSALAGDNQLLGGEGNDVLIGGSGNNVLDGGTGTDIAVFVGAVEDYAWQLSNTGQTQLRHTTSGSVQTLKDVEWLHIGGTLYRLLSTTADHINPSLASHIELLGVAEKTGIEFHTQW